MLIDCFSFFNEFDMLELRLNELKEIVDLFVITEATLNFRGKEKPLFFADNKDRFKDFPIKHVVLDTYDVDINDSKKMDAYQRQYSLDIILKDIEPSSQDYILMADCDEIPKVDKIIEAMNYGSDRNISLEMPLYYYWMNCVCYSMRWRYVKLVKPKKILDFKEIRFEKTNPKLYNSGWHFSYLDDIYLKIKSWTHSEYDKPPYNTLEHIKKCKEQGLDLYNRHWYKFKFVYDLGFLPKYVLNNMDKYGKYIKKENI